MSHDVSQQVAYKVLIMKSVLEQVYLDRIRRCEKFRIGIIPEKSEGDYLR